MNSRIQDKIKEIKQLSAQSRPDRQFAVKADNSTKDGLSMAIRTQKDADTFMAELNSISKKNATP